MIDNERGKNKRIRYQQTDKETPYSIVNLEDSSTKKELIMCHTLSSWLQSKPENEGCSLAANYQRFSTTGIRVSHSSNSTQEPEKNHQEPPPPSTKNMIIVPHDVPLKAPTHQISGYNSAKWAAYDLQFSIFKLYDKVKPPELLNRSDDTMELFLWVALLVSPHTKKEHRNNGIPSHSLPGTFIPTEALYRCEKVEHDQVNNNRWFPAQSVGSSNTDVLDLPCLLVLITETSQSRQHVITSLIHIESCKSPTKSLFDVGSSRISISQL
ncbi:hypothetical protein Tco_0678286 [Tanacetum coccineum]|uniref:Uncharacterized protein n=1 Tax=Tanacetum coccineum TaxID=301880 RepID=A0ABQ4XEK3_9ASTR